MNTLPVCRKALARACVLSAVIGFGVAQSALADSKSITINQSTDYGGVLERLTGGDSYVVQIGNGESTFSPGYTVDGEGEEFGSDYPIDDFQIDLDSKSETVGVKFRDSGTTPSLTFYTSAGIRAKTALSGVGQLIYASGTLSSTIDGNLDFSGSTISVYATDDVDSVPTGLWMHTEGEVGELVASGSSVKLAPGTSLRANALNIVSSSVILEGFPNDGIDYGNGAWLFVHTGDSQQPTAGVVGENSTISVEGNAALVIGTSLGEFASGTTSVSDQSDLIRQKMTSLLADADQVSLTQKSTLITASPTVSESDGGLETTQIHVGDVTSNANNGNNSVVIAADGRWIVYCPEYTSNTTGIEITPQTGATLILYDWNPQDPHQTGIEIPNAASWMDNNTYIVSHYARGRLVLDEAENVLRPKQITCDSFPGLRAREIVSEVETSTNKSNLMSLPGYRFILDGFSSANVGDDAYANHVDSVVFMPVNSGVLASAEQTHTSLINRLLHHQVAHDESSSDWWVDVVGEKRTVKDAYQGGSGKWGYEADTACVSLGYDRRFKNDWFGTVAISGAKTDTKTRNLLTRVDGKATSATLTVQAYRETGMGRIGAQVSYSQIQAEATKLATEHRLKTEPDMCMASFSTYWQKTSELSKQSTVSPWLSVSGHYVKLKDANVTDSTKTGQYGVGFEGDIDQRYFGQVQAGADWRAESTLGRYAFSGGIGAYATASFGDTDFRMRTNIRGSTVSSVGSYASTPAWSARIEAHLNLGNSGYEPVLEGGLFGFGAKDTGKTCRFAWNCELLAAYERAEYTSSAWQVGFRYRSLF